MGLPEQLTRPLQFAPSCVDLDLQSWKDVSGHQWLQGCPISVVLLNALVSVWTKAVEAEVPLATPDAFADDTGALAPDLNTIQEVVDLTADFAACTKQELSIKKSFAFCSDPTEDCTVKLHGSEMKAVADADVLGARISFQGGRVEEPLRSKAATAKLIAERILLAPLAFEQRALLVRALVTSKVTHGSAIAAIPWSDLKALHCGLISCLGASLQVQMWRGFVFTSVPRSCH